MNDGSPISGHYSSKQYVLVRGKQFRDELRVLGHYGSDIIHARLKETDRLELDSTSSPDEPATILTLQEAYFLAHALGCLAISGHDKSEALSLKSTWESFREYYSSSNHALDFAIEYGVYHYFRSRGWIVKGGEIYGTNFLLYQEGPSVDHAKYGVVIVCRKDPKKGTGNFTWKSLLTFHRVIQSVSKELLLVYVDFPDSESDIMFRSPDCISRMGIFVTTFVGQATVPEPVRQQ